MGDIQEQLAILRRKIARIDRKYAMSPPPRPATAAQSPHPALRPARYLIEQIMSGEVVRNKEGEHFVTERVWERHRRHGSVDISSLAELPHDLLAALSEGAIPAADPRKCAFLDTETTGLAGGAGTYAFLIGVGSIEDSGFHLRQFFMRDYAEEPSLLAGLSEYLSRFDVLITYNGKTYDQPLLETRYRMARTRTPFERLAHLDLLFGARRLWKLRLDTCRLVELENRILGFEREGDLPGEMIPYYYYEYLRSQQAFRLAPIFHHNAFDILSLACLTAIVPAAFRAPDDAAFHHGADLLGLARWLVQAGRVEDGLRLLRRAVDLGLPDDLLFRTLWEIAGLERKLEREPAAVTVLEDLAVCRNPYRARAFEELAKYYEHRERNFTRALELTRAAIELGASPALLRREQRLQSRSQPRARRGRRLPL